MSESTAISRDLHHLPGHDLDANNAVPDFIVRGLRGKMAIEAVTVGPTRVNGGIVSPPTTETPEKLDAYLNDYMPIKFGSPLYSKLRKEYWKEPQISGLPLVFAIADFSSPESMLQSRPALERYLYGFSFERNPDPKSTVPVVATKIAEHRWGEKVIPSGFFDIPNACNVSAVISTSSGTIAKFNRMGLNSGFGADDILMIRRGTCFDKRVDANTLLGFEVIVNCGSYIESWVEGLNVYHNPNARIPLDEALIPGAAHHHCSHRGEWRTQRRFFSHSSPELR